MGKIKYPIEICAMCKKTGFAVDMVQTTIEGNNELYLCIKCSEIQNISELTADEILELLDEKDIYYSIGEYCEPGYSSDKPVLFFDSYIGMDSTEGLDTAIEEYFEIAYNDEYLQCEDCNKYFRSQADSYHWTMYGKIFDDSTVLCGDCIKSDTTEYVEYLLNNPNAVDTIGIDLEALGFEQLNPFELNSGLYEYQHGKEHNPKDIMESYQVMYPDKDIIFGSLYAEQFQVRFDIYGRDKV